jgi:hypothetical protein
VWFVFLLLDDGMGHLTHHLLEGFERGCFLGSAFDLVCLLVVV